jgi:hypothetical protein
MDFYDAAVQYSADTGLQNSEVIKNNADKIII